MLFLEYFSWIGKWNLRTARSVGESMRVAARRLFQDTSPPTAPGYFSMTSSL